MRRRPCSRTSLVTDRILYARIFGSGARPRNPPYTTFYHVRRRSCSEKIFSLQAEILTRKTLVGAPARPRNPLYTTFYHVRRRSCFREIFSLQAEILTQNSLVDAPAVTTRASLACDSMSALCVAKTMRRQPVASCINALNPNFKVALKRGQKHQCISNRH